MKKRMDYKNFCDRIVPDRGFLVPNQLYLKKKEPGVFFGYADESEHDMYVGMPQGTDGNIIIIGGNGSGKSSGIIKPTLETWQGAICATDIKGELTEHYKRMYECALQNETESNVQKGVNHGYSHMNFLPCQMFWFCLLMVSAEYKRGSRRIVRWRRAYLKNTPTTWRTH